MHSLFPVNLDGSLFCCGEMSKIEPTSPNKCRGPLSGKHYALPLQTKLIQVQRVMEWLRWLGRLPLVQVSADNQRAPTKASSRTMSPGPCLGLNVCIYETWIG